MQTNKYYLFFIWICLFSIGYVLSQGDPCNQYTNCQDCLYRNINCGWCASNGTCLSGDATGPTPPAVCKNKNDSLPMMWQWTTSYVRTNSTTPGSSISPNLMEVFLRPGIPLNITLNIKVPFIPPIDFLFLVDASESMAEIILTVSENMVNITTSLQQLIRDGGGDSSVVFGLASFLEKPIMPVGNFPEGFVYNMLSPLTDDVPFIQSQLNALSTNLSRNYDLPEDCFDALIACSLNQEFNYRPGTFHVVMVVTDASGHLAGDGKLMGIYTPNNLDGVLDGWPPGTGEDYPSIEGIKQVLRDNDVNPLFGIANPKVLSFYTNLVNEWKDFGSAFEFVPSSVVESILQGTEKVLNQAILDTIMDDLLLIDSVSPNNGTYNNVTRNSTIQFNVVLHTPLSKEENYGLNGTVKLKYLGFSSVVTMNIVTAVKCLGCDPNNPTFVVDVCRVCGGNNSQCTGCDGNINEQPTLLDVCGVCGGDGSSCLGCNGTAIPLGGAVYDVCGICDGTNSTCLGCDGIPLSGLQVNGCGVCGGPVNCNNGLVPAIIALSVFAGIAAIILIVALLLGLCVKVRMAQLDDMMVEEEAALQENPLYEAAKKKFDNPFFEGGGESGIQVEDN